MVHELLVLVEIDVGRFQAVRTVVEAPRECCADAALSAYHVRFGDREAPGCQAFTVHLVNGAHDGAQGQLWKVLKIVDRIKDEAVPPLFGESFEVAIRCVHLTHVQVRRMRFAFLQYLGFPLFVEPVPQRVASHEPG